MAEKRFQPSGDRILLKPVDAQTKTAGGIIIPDNAKEKPLEGSVVAVGNGKVLENGERKSLEIKVGDHVLYGKWSGTSIKLNNEEFLVLKEDEILAIVQ